MNDATLAQGNQVLNLILQQNVPVERLQNLLASGLLSDLLKAESPEEIDRWEFQQLIGLCKKKNGTAVIPQFVALNDGGMPKRLRGDLEKWRTMAEKHFDYHGSVAWLVPASFNIKTHASADGPCYQQFEFLRGWKLHKKVEKYTHRQLAFWIPKVVPNTNLSNTAQQLSLLAKLRKEFWLPNHHLTSFGSAHLLSGLILHNHRVTAGNKAPELGQWVRTDTTCYDDKRSDYRMCLGGDDQGWLNCVDHHWDDMTAVKRLWCFALGLEELQPGEYDNIPA